MNFVSTLIIAQNIEVRGVVIDSSTLLPIPYASVGIKNLGIGTLTNEKGRFILKVPDSEQTQIINIQIIGYKTYSLKVKSVNKSEIICKLVPSPKELKEVVVIPEDTLLTILRTAYKRISKNYPEKPLMLTGFFREVQKANDSLYLNFTEAILEVYKQGYNNNSNFGQVRIIQSRKNNFPGTDTINNVRFFGGPHIVHMGDFVFKRSNFINPRHFKNYSYWLADIKKTGKEEIYCVGFKHNNDSILGTLYLDKNSLAYIGLEIYEKRDKAQLLHFYKHKDATKKIGYVEYKGKWYLSYAILNTSGENTNLNKRVTLHEVYVTTSIKTDSVKPIPFNQELGYTDVISIKADEYSKTTWKDYNILAEDSNLCVRDSYNDEESKKILSKNYSNKKNKRDLFFEVIRHFEFRYGIEYLPLNFKGGNYQISNNIIPGLTQTMEKNLSSISYTGLLYTKIAYTFNSHLGMFYSSVGSFKSPLSFSSWDLGIQYGTPLFKNSRKWFIDFNIGYSRSQYFYEFGEADKISNKVLINRKTFDAKKINVLIGTRYTALNPSFAISYKLRKITYLFLTVSRAIYLNDVKSATFKEKSGFFLFRKSSNVSFDNNQFQLYQNGILKNDVGFDIQPFRIALGLSFKF